MELLKYSMSSLHIWALFLFILSVAIFNHFLSEFRVNVLFHAKHKELGTIQLYLAHSSLCTTVIYFISMYIANSTIILHYLF